MDFSEEHEGTLEWQRITINKLWKGLLYMQNDIMLLSGISFCHPRTKKEISLSPTKRRLNLLCDQRLGVNPFRRLSAGPMEGKGRWAKLRLDSTERWGLMQPVVYRGLQGLEVKGKGSQGIVDAWRMGVIDRVPLSELPGLYRSWPHCNRLDGWHKQVCNNIGLPHY